jgi:hypothetical protein
MSAPTEKLERIRALIDLGIQLVWLPLKSKGQEQRKGWQTEQFALDAWAKADGNTGIKTGAPIRTPDGADGEMRMYDVEGDEPYSISALKVLAPPSGMTFGRKSKAEAHRLYAATAKIESRQFKDIDNTMRKSAMHGRRSWTGCSCRWVRPTRY